MKRQDMTVEQFQAWFEENDRFGALIGGKLVHLDETVCEFTYEAKPEHLNPNGILHGGALYTIMDSSQGALVHAALDPQFISAVTGTATIRYSAPVTSGKIHIRTTIERKEGRKLFVHSSAADASGATVAVLDEIWIAIAANR